MDKNRKCGRLIRRIAGLLLCAALTAAAFVPQGISAEAALKKPANCRFQKWMNTEYTKCYIKWEKVSGAKGYQTAWTWADGTHKKLETWKGQADGIVYNVPNNRVSVIRVRAYKGSGSSKSYGAWSDPVYITPSPATIAWKWSYVKGVPTETFEWNRVVGTCGYRIYMKTEELGSKWYLTATTNKSTALKAVVNKYRGKKFKQGEKGQEIRYYFRIVSLRKIDGKVVEGPMYNKTWGPGYFYFTK